MNCKKLVYKPQELEDTSLLSYLRDDLVNTWYELEPRCASFVFGFKP